MVFSPLLSTPQGQKARTLVHRLESEVVELSPLDLSQTLDDVATLSKSVPGEIVVELLYKIVADLRVHAVKDAVSAMEKLLSGIPSYFSLPHR